MLARVIILPAVLGTALMAPYLPGYPTPQSGGLHSFLIHNPTA